MLRVDGRTQRDGENRAEEVCYSFFLNRTAFIFDFSSIGLFVSLD